MVCMPARALCKAVVEELAKFTNNCPLVACGRALQKRFSLDVELLLCVQTWLLLGSIRLACMV